MKCKNCDKKIGLLFNPCDMWGNYFCTEECKKEYKKKKINNKSNNGNPPFPMGAFILLIIIISVGWIMYGDGKNKTENTIPTAEDKKIVEETLKSVKYLSDGIQELDGAINELINKNAQRTTLYAIAIKAKNTYNQECLAVEYNKRKKISVESLEKRFDDALDMISLGLCSKGTAFEKFADLVDTSSVKSENEAILNLQQGEEMVLRGTTLLIVLAKEMGISVDE